MADARMEYVKRIDALEAMRHVLHKCKVDYAWSVPREYQASGFAAHIDASISQLDLAISPMTRDLNTPHECIRLDENDIVKIVDIVTEKMRTSSDANNVCNTILKKLKEAGYKI